MDASEHPVSLATLVDQAPDAVIFAGLDGRIRYWNAAAERIFGYPAAEALGQSLDLIIPEQFRDAHWTGYDRALADGATKYEGQSLPTRSQRADGQEIYVELSFAIIHGDEEGHPVTGALAYARDITERFARDRASRRKLRELEQELEQLRSDTPA